MQAAVDELGATQLARVKRNSWGTPLVSSIFHLAREASESPFLAYVNADILLTPDFLRITKLVASQIKHFLIVGQRWDLDVTQPVVFDEGWDQNLRERTKQEGNLHPPAGSDFFIFPRTHFMDLPDFAIGRAGWDNWMIYKALQSGWHVVDATSSLMIIHQNHDYGHLPGGVPHYDLEETTINATIGGGHGNMFMTLDTNYELINGNICRPRWTQERILRRLERLFYPKDGEDHSIRWRVARRFRRMRRGVV